MGQTDLYRVSWTQVPLHINMCYLEVIFSPYILEHGSQRFTQFLELLGDEVQLRGWKQFRGGLDTKSESCVIVC